MKAGKKIKAIDIFAISFGIFLGLAIWKFGNPVILDHKIIPPRSAADFWNGAWPLRWAGWIFLSFAIAGAFLVFQKKNFPPINRWLLILPLAWLGWQFVSATKTVDASLTAATLWQYGGCVTAYFIGLFLFGNRRVQLFLLAGILTAFTFCLVRAVDQRLFEFPQNYQMLVQGENDGWTNYPAEMLAEMKAENIIISTNGMDIANPVILKKFQNGRVAGTLVYPNALAGLILMLLPVALVVAFQLTKQLKPSIHWGAMTLAFFLGGAAFFWTGSKLGWLIGLLIGGTFLLRMNWPARLKLAAVALVLVFGCGIFLLRFHTYFSAGATSAGARLDYWEAAVKTTQDNFFYGTGPGTFQRPYAQLKPPRAEMARLTHNDYLEQFSDSGIPGGLFYAAWVFLALKTACKNIRRKRDLFSFAMFSGLIGWFLQGFGEFSLFIPAMAWTAFTLLGSLLAVESE